MPNCFYPYDHSDCTCGTCVDYDIDQIIHPTEEDLAEQEELDAYDEYLRQMADNIDIAETNFAIPNDGSYINTDDLPF